ncbi:Asp-domain-containing protein [Hesseltinella vesiculosa]|uniref:rhizopuspepsin n=1 Tax=Hesseltinella vesiculosa TaxID=101127 RepID=A0A1X2GIQ5_9FUNG|nr:Asp-domain-containing protein [Hesseltinella vesiculosa]
MHIWTSFLLTGLVASVVQGAEDSIIRAPIYRTTSTANWLKKRMIAKRDGTAPLYNDQGSQYLITVGIGSPAQNFTVALDTGSADLWVPSSSCPTSACPFDRFSSGNSSTFQDLGVNFTIQYGIGKAAGSYAQDTVTIGGIAVPKQQFGLATSSQDILTNPNSVSSPGGSGSGSVNSDGILGMGYPLLTAEASASGKSYNPVIFNMVQQKLISQSLFSIYMNTVSSEGWAGEVLFGGIDSSKYTGNLVYLPVVTLSSSGLSSGNYYYWMVYGQSISVTGGNSDVTVNFNSTSSSSSAINKALILDTGTTLTYLPTAITQQLMNALTTKYKYDSSSGVFVVDCSLQQSNASFVLAMSNTASPSANPVTLTVPVKSLVIPVTSSQCMFGVAPMDSSSSSANSIGSTMYLIGDSFLRSAYMVFDIGNNRVGLAAANGVGGAVNGVTASSSSASSFQAPPAITTALIGGLALLFSALFC